MIEETEKILSMIELEIYGSSLHECGYKAYAHIVKQDEEIKRLKEIINLQTAWMVDC